MLWKGIVKIDPSIFQYVLTTEEEDDLKVMKIVDSNYPQKDNAQLDNLADIEDFPNEVMIFVKGKEVLEYMNCSVIQCYNSREEDDSARIFKNRDNPDKTVIKGFILEPIIEDAHSDINACLGSTQIDNSFGNSLTIEKGGLFAFTSGTKTSNITFRDPSRSVTIAFVATKDRPFVAYFRSRKRMFKLTCDNRGVSTEEVLMTGKGSSNPANTHQEDPVKILKTRLAKGEITIEEYQRLRKIIEDEKTDPNNNFWI